jgi:hypothetical protein
MSLGLLYNQSSPGVRFLNTIIFYRMGLLAPCSTPVLEDQGVSLLVWILPFDLTGMGGPAGSYTTTGIALWVIESHKPHHHDKVGTPVGGSNFIMLAI